MANEVVKQVAQNVRDLRKKQGLTMSELSRRSGLSKGALSQLESGQSNPTVETLWVLSEALSVPFGDLITTPTQRPTTVIRSNEATWIEGVPVSSALMARLNSPGVTEMHTISLRQGVRRDSKAHAVGLVEVVAVTSGSMLIGPIDDPVELQPGDVATYGADRPHVYQARTATASGMLLMIYPSA